MEIIAKTAFIALLLLVSAGTGFSADIKVPVKPAESVKVDTRAAVADKGTTSGKAADTIPTTKAPLIDINSATEAELKAVPGIGDAFAAKIVAGRPYANKAQLKSRKILPATLYEQIKERVIAKQPPKKEKEPTKPAAKK